MKVREFKNIIQKFLLRNTSKEEEKVLNETGSWTATFAPQPKYEADGTEIQDKVE